MVSPHPISRRDRPLCLSSYPAGETGYTKMRNGEQTFRRDHACLKRLVLQHRLLPLMRWLRLCLRRAATDFFSTAKKVGERGTTAPAVQKCRSQTPRGWHSANRFTGRTTCVGLQGGLQNGCGLRDGLARCARWHDLMVFWDGLVAMASLNDWVRSREIACGQHIASHQVNRKSIKNV